MLLQDAAEVQITDTSINGKAELRGCAASRCGKGTVDAATGKHVLYLNSRAESETAAGTEAKQFL